MLRNGLVFGADPALNTSLAAGIAWVTLRFSVVLFLFLLQERKFIVRFFLMGRKERAKPILKVAKQSWATRPFLDTHWHSERMCLSEVCLGLPSCHSAAFFGSSPERFIWIWYKRGYSSKINPGWVHNHKQLLSQSWHCACLLLWSFIFLWNISCKPWVVTRHRARWTSGLVSPLKKIWSSLKQMRALPSHKLFPETGRRALVNEQGKACTWQACCRKGGGESFWDEVIVQKADYLQSHFTRTVWIQRSMNIGINRPVMRNPCALHIWTDDTDPWVASCEVKFLYSSLSFRPMDSVPVLGSSKKLFHRREN